MNAAINDMLANYEIRTTTDAENALKEIIQEIALLGLYRAKFFEKAAFYGGTALRILYALPRFSEDLDFTLMQPDRNFSLKPYFSAVVKELEAYGFQTEIESVQKNVASEVASAFIKANTKTHVLQIQTAQSLNLKANPDAKLKIKFEVDTDPVTDFSYEARYLLAPTSFSIITLQKPDLFAGKLHAMLYRQGKNRIKGRDFYDYVWYLKTKTPVELTYLREKAIQSGHATAKDLLDLEQLKHAIFSRIDTVDFAKAKDDVMPFIKDPQELALWNRDFFRQITESITIVS